MDAVKIGAIVNKRHPLDGDEMAFAASVLEEYPYFQALRAVQLRTCLMSGAASLGADAGDAIYLPDRKRFYAWAMTPLQEEQPVHSPSGSRTLDLIDTFLSKSSHETDGGDGAAIGDVPPHQPAIKTVHQQSSDTVAKASHEADAHSDAGGGDYSLDEDNIDEACFTETLARIYIKQERYEKALEIIRKLSLKYPKKNAYFADQIRTLEQLIINSKTDSK